MQNSISFNKKILIVDDDNVSRKILADYLISANYKIDSVENGAKAWELLQHAPETYAIVLADRVMLGIDAMELLRRIKHSAKLQNVLVIILTGEAEPEDFVEAVTAGAFDFIYKPIDQELLSLVIENAVTEYQNHI